jgi:hypothetical protein
MKYIQALDTKRNGTVWCDACAKKKYPNLHIVKSILGRLKGKNHPTLEYYRCPLGAGYHFFTKRQ